MLGLCHNRLQLKVAPSRCTIPAVDYPNHFRCFQKGPVFSSSFSSKSLVQGEAQTHEKAHSFAASYLINTFGLSPELALSVSKKQEYGKYLKSSEKADAVIKLLKDYGLSDAHISQIVVKRLELLIYDAEKTFLPKLEFFSSIGISGNALAHMICSFPNILCISLERSIKPFYDISKTLRIPEEKLPLYFMSCGRMFNPEHLRNVARNVSILQANDVPESSYSLWLSFDIKALSFESEKVKENVDKVISMGFGPSSPKFMKALYVISVTDSSKWERKMEFYKKWGWTEDDVMLAFGKSPLFLICSEDNISNKMDFYLNKMGLKPADVAQIPDILFYSLKKRIIPRCSVIRILLLKGLERWELLALRTIVRKNDTYFLDRFVIKHQEQVPELFRIFQGEMTLAELGLGFEETGV